MPPKRKGAAAKLASVDVVEEKAEDVRDEPNLKKSKSAKEHEAPAEMVDDKKQAGKSKVHGMNVVAGSQNLIPKETVYEFTVELDSIRPKIWRKFQIPSTFTFAKLHTTIQRCMGWGDCHLHEFRMKHPRTPGTQYIGSPFDAGLDDFKHIQNESNIQISEYFTEENKKAKYIYDFGEDWYHTLTFDKVLPKKMDGVYPVCVSGKRACPPEDPPEDFDYESYDSETFDPKNVKFPIEDVVDDMPNVMKDVSAKELAAPAKENVVPEKQEAETSNSNKATTILKEGGSQNLDTDMVLQFTIELYRIRPRIWRKIQVPSTYTFLDMHKAIQCCFGWRNCHLHEFRMKHPKTAEDQYIGSPFDTGLDDYKIRNEDKLKIADYFSAENKKGKYIYDLGFGWDHIITFDKILPKKKNAVYPVCVSGRRATPPEDPPEDFDYDCFDEVTFDPKAIKFDRFNKKSII